MSRADHRARPITGSCSQRRKIRARLSERPGMQRLAVALVLLLLALGGCRQDMHDQARYDPLEVGSFFDDGRASRQPVDGTVPRGGLREDELLYTGRIDGELARVFPFEVTRKVLERGRERYDIFCSPCHDRLGSGNGMVVRRGFPAAASFHIQRLRDEPHGYYVDVITRGFGRMPSYADQIPAPDRWAITAYVRALQLSQMATLADVPEAERARLEAEREVK